MARAPGSLTSLRAHNRARVLSVLQARGGASQADIARMSGLSRTTVSSLVGELLADGTVVERSDATRQAPSPNGGRPPTLLTLDPSSGGFVGVDFGRESVRIAVTNRVGDVLADARSGRLEVAHQAEEALAIARSMLAKAVPEAGLAPERLLGAGVAVSAPVRADSPRFASEVIFPSWSGIDVAAALGPQLGVPVYLENDANLGALAESTFGAARTVRNVLYVMLSEGIGGGVIIDGRIYKGHTGTTGELGHVVVNPEGQVCRCGNRGCLATVAGGAALTDALRQTYGGEMSLDEVITLVQDGDPGATRVIADAGRAVGRVLAGMCSLLDPGLVVIGGELAPAGEPLLDAIRRSLGRWISPALGRKYSVVAGELGARAEVLGAVALAMNRFAEAGLAAHDAVEVDAPKTGVTKRRTRRQKQPT
jgi:predicted NBD/HSP70 family sugar kinase/biotin operon repressor